MNEKNENIDKKNHFNKKEGFTIFQFNDELGEFEEIELKKGIELYELLNPEADYFFFDSIHHRILSWKGSKYEVEELNDFLKKMREIKPKTKREKIKLYEAQKKPLIFENSVSSYKKAIQNLEDWVKRFEIEQKLKKGKKKDFMKKAKVDLNKREIGIKYIETIYWFLNQRIKFLEQYIKNQEKRETKDHRLMYRKRLINHYIEIINMINDDKDFNMVFKRLLEVYGFRKLDFSFYH